MALGMENAPGAAVRVRRREGLLRLEHAPDVIPEFRGLTFPAVELVPLVRMKFIVRPGHGSLLSGKPRDVLPPAQRERSAAVMIERAGKTMPPTYMTDWLVPAPLRKRRSVTVRTGNPVGVDRLKFRIEPAHRRYKIRRRTRPAA
jgi:hypothetical protein